MTESQQGTRMGPSICMVAIALALCGVARSTAQSLESSPREQLKQCVADLQKNPSDDSLREKIIKLALTLHPQPATPPEADELAGRAKYIFEHANSNDDLLKAADAFGKVSLVVPWAPDYYFDSAVAYEKANDPTNALKNYKWCLLAGPNSQDAKAVREKIGALSYVLEQQQAAAQAEQARRDAEAQAERQREVAAEQAREQAQHEEQQRLANRDPMIRSLDGAVFQSKINRRGTLWVWTLSGYKMIVSIRQSDGYTTNASYVIDGQQFYIPWTDTNPNDSCWRFYRTNDCGWRGIIGQNVISFEFVADGKPQSEEMGTVGGNAKRIR